MIIIMNEHFCKNKCNNLPSVEKSLIFIDEYKQNAKVTGI